MYIKTTEELVCRERERSRNQFLIHDGYINQIILLSLACKIHEACCGAVFLCDLKYDDNSPKNHLQQLEDYIANVKERYAKSGKKFSVTFVTHSKGTHAAAMLAFNHLQKERKEKDKEELEINGIVSIAGRLRITSGRRGVAPKYMSKSTRFPKECKNTQSSLSYLLLQKKIG